MKRGLLILLCVLSFFILCSCDTSEFDAAVQASVEQVNESSQRRFSAVYDKGSFFIVVDNETGVNYLGYASGYKGGITPLLDAFGEVVVTPVD